MKKINCRTKAFILAVILAVLLLSIYACGILIPEETAAGSFMNAKQPPDSEHIFGTDALGRDLFLRTLKGLSVSITVGAAASLISAVIAVLAGIAAASGSRRVDGAVNWVIDLVMSVPHTILIILISFALGRGLKGLLAGIAATHAGVSGKAVDAAARAVIDAAGYGKYFVHSYGHGLGIRIHEEPYASPAGEKPLCAGADGAVPEALFWV